MCYVDTGDSDSTWGSSVPGGRVSWIYLWKWQWFVHRHWCIAFLMLPWSVVHLH